MPFVRFLMGLLGIIFGVEVGLMFALPRILPAEAPLWVEAVADGTLLTLGATGPIWWLLCGSLRRTTRDLSASEETARTALQDLWLRRFALDNHAIVSEADSRGRITYVNNEFCRISGYSREELLGRDHRLLNSGVHPREFWKEMYAALARDGVWRGDVCNRAKSGALYWVHSTNVAARDASGRIVSHISIRVDITARKQMENELRDAARTDKLTGLANRALLCDRLQQAVLRSKRLKDYRYAVLFLDFDRFKLVNDSLGHGMGDCLLKSIATRLRQAVRASDSLSQDVRDHTTARFGGDEFVVLLDGIRKSDDADMVAERLLKVFSEPFRLGEHDVYSTASIGIVTSDLAADNADEVLRSADTAMYEAKLAGKARSVHFHVSMHSRIKNRLNLENELRKALDTGQLFLMYQPVVSLETRAIEGVEALIRWMHPQRGLMLPDEFIPIAEESGLIVPIGEWVLYESCRQFARWRESMGDTAPPRIMVNLSRNQLALRDLPATIRRILDETGVPPPCLSLEITESTAMQDVESTKCILQALKKMGVKLSLDNFGTGNSSFACLDKLPIDVLKIDRSFVANIDRSHNLMALIHTAVGLAHNLHIHVVAEGVETLDQVAALQAMECQFGQGYIFSKPLTAEQFENLNVPTSSLPGQLGSKPRDALPGIPIASPANA